MRLLPEAENNEKPKRRLANLVHESPMQNSLILFSVAFNSHVIILCVGTLIYHLASGRFVQEAEKTPSRSRKLFAATLVLSVVTEVVFVAFIGVCQMNDDSYECAGLYASAYSLASVLAFTYLAAVIHRFKRIRLASESESVERKRSRLSGFRKFVAFSMACAMLALWVDRVRRGKGIDTSVSSVFATVTISLFFGQVFLCATVMTVSLLEYIKNFGIQYIAGHSLQAVKMKTYVMFCMASVFVVLAILDHITWKLFGPGLFILYVYMQMNILEAIRNWVKQVAAEKKSQLLTSYVLNMDAMSQTSGRNPQSLLPSHHTLRTESKSTWRSSEPKGVTFPTLDKIPTQSTFRISRWEPVRQSIGTTISIRSTVETNRTTGSSFSSLFSGRRYDRALKGPPRLRAIDSASSNAGSSSTRSSQYFDIGAVYARFMK